MKPDPRISKIWGPKFPFHWSINYLTLASWLTYGILILHYSWTKRFLPSHLGNWSAYEPPRNKLRSQPVDFLVVFGKTCGCEKCEKLLWNTVWVRNCLKVFFHVFRGWLIVRRFLGPNNLPHKEGRIILRIGTWNFSCLSSIILPHLPPKKTRLRNARNLTLLDALANFPSDLTSILGRIRGADARDWLMCVRVVFMLLIYDIYIYMWLKCI